MSFSGVFSPGRTNPKPEPGGCSAQHGEEIFVGAWTYAVKIAAVRIASLR